MLQPVVLVIGAAVAFCVYVVFRTLRQYYALKDFGGPWCVGLTRLWLLWANGCGKMHLVFTEVNDKYGEHNASNSFYCDRQEKVWTNARLDSHLFEAHRITLPN
jgi:hypothetical protein